MNSGEVAQHLHQAAALLEQFPETTEALRLLEAAKNAISAAQAHLAVEMTDTLAYETAGYATPKAFLRAELGLDTNRANDLLAAGPTLRVLPALDEVAMEGAVSLDHVKHFTYCLNHVGESVTREFLPELVDVATKAEPASLRMVTRKLREAVYPDDLDKAWAEGMAKEDIQVNPVPDGFHITGFVNTTTGAKLRAVLQSLSAPTGADDPRTGAQRRVDGLEKLLDGVLTGGLPQDKGVRPQVTVTVDADTLKNHEGTGDLIGYGAIGVDQVQQIVCEAEVTPIVIDKKDRNKVLDVGRSKRLGMRTQRQAVLARQNSICAAPGCQAPVVHIHHVIWWSHGGATDLANLIGL